MREGFEINENGLTITPLSLDKIEVTLKELRHLVSEIESHTDMGDCPICNTDLGFKGTLIAPNGLIYHESCWYNKDPAFHVMQPHPQSPLSNAIYNEENPQGME